MPNDSRLFMLGDLLNKFFTIVKQREFVLCTDSGLISRPDIVMLFCGISGHTGVDLGHEAAWLTRDYCGGQPSLTMRNTRVEYILV
jgi:hypothetical protein